MAPPPLVLQKLEVSVLVDVPRRDSEAFSARQSVPLRFNFPPFCSGDWSAFVQWKGFKGSNSAPRSGVFGLDFDDVEDRVAPLGESRMLLERLDGHVLVCTSLLPSSPSDSQFLPFEPSGQIWLCDDFDPPRSSGSQVRFRIILEFEASSVVCSCRRRSTRRFDDLLDSQVVNDVRFYFPHVQRELWSSSAALSKGSSYFKSLFEGGFSESSDWVSEPTTILDLGSRNKDRTFGDSDDDEDDKMTSGEWKGTGEKPEARAASKTSRAPKKKEDTGFSILLIFLSTTPISRSRHQKPQLHNLPCPSRLA